MLLKNIEKLLTKQVVQNFEKSFNIFASANSTISYENQQKFRYAILQVKFLKVFRMNEVPLL